MSYTENADNPNQRLSLNELRKIPSYSDVSDEEGEAILNDLLAFSRMILEVIN
ncbi:hypothetical protein LZ575_19905 [Antarcticibacterium sp. 1MA-6-2]|uniref:hypothetical protein n=1 Tax=Antarcticibacterium sp. 1MA-6-2 TaxID=2908210 RepID=UPI001F27B433|nr:hypothetical protein [Antarcticibacterium sp. 1MA-6-2]UJH90927.1 hypothetical protein LZ575_19905 [Antarcticibacterium sp. 1MA-6-2]